MDKPAVARTPEPGTPPFSIWQLLGLLAGPLIFLFIYFLVRPDGMPLAATAVLASSAWIATWWLTGATPPAVASLLPLVLFPVLGVTTLSEAAAPYANPTVCLLVGGLLIAIAAERWNLYRRIALSIVSLVGASPGRLVLGCLTVTAILSMWLSTTLTLLLTLPAGLALITQMTALQKRTHGQKIVAIGGAPTPHFAPALILSIAYGAAFGGFSPRSGPFSFLPWLMNAVPYTVLAVACGWLIVRLVCPPELNELPGGKVLIGQERAALGPATVPEKLALGVFAAVSVMWITRPCLITPYLPQVDDATIALAGGLLLFLIPSDLSQNQWLLTADAMQKLPWRIPFLFGAGFSIASAAGGSGLSEWIAGSLPPVLTGTGATAGLAILSLIVTAVLAPSFLNGRSELTFRQMARAGAWLSVAGTAIISFFTYVWIPFVLG